MSKYLYKSCSHNSDIEMWSTSGADLNLIWHALPGLDESRSVRFRVAVKTVLNASRTFHFASIFVEDPHYHISKVHGNGATCAMSQTSINGYLHEPHLYK